MSKPFTLYWSNLEKFENCPKSFLWSRGWGDIDLGNGPGKKKTPTHPSSEHHRIMGNSIQYAVEKLYNDELWKTVPRDKLADKLIEIAKSAFAYNLKKKYVNWSESPSRAELLDLIESAVYGYLRTMKHHKLLAPYARAEVDMLGYADPLTPIGGRPDVILESQREGVSILDGKNGKRHKVKDHWETYTDPDQLRWYALCYFLAYGKLPDRLGFVYYRYPYGMEVKNTQGQTAFGPDGLPLVEEGILWVPFTKADLDGLAERAVKAKAAMVREEFTANPVPSTCKFCDYEDVCEERQKTKRRVNKKEFVFDGQILDNRVMDISL